MQALSKYPAKSPIRTAILIELANDLITLNLKSEAINYYEQALECIVDQTTRVTCLRQLLDLQIECGK